MASYVPAAKNEALVFYISLESQAAPGTFQANPTLASGDVLVATDDAAPANIASLPSVDADFTKRVKVSLSAGEMNGDNITVIFSDAAGAEWYDLTVNIQTATNQIDDLATAAALAAGVTVASNGIAAASIATGAITAAKFAAGAIDAAAIADNAIDAGAIASNAITSAKIASSAISSAKIASNAIDSTKIASGALTSAAFASGAITQSAIAAGALIDSKFGSGAITADILAADAAAEIADAVWDEAMADHVTAGTTGNALYNAYLNATTVLARLGAFTGTGVNTVIGFFQALMRSDATTPSDVGGTYDDATDSLQAIKDGGLSLGAGAITSSTFASGAITADAIAADAIGASELATDAVTEIANAVQAALAGVDSVTVVSTVAGATATVYQYSTWEAAFTLSGSPGLTGYENLIFAVKRYASDTDAQSVLYVNSSTGLIYIGQAAATGASYGSLTADSATQFTVYVDVAEVASKIANSFAGGFTWSLKGVETGTTPDEAIVIAEGTWRIEPGIVRSIT